MKRIAFIIFLFSSVLSKAQIATNCTSPSNSNLLGFEELKGYVFNYHATHINSVDNHTKAIYMNDTAVLFLESFFQNSTNKKYFGLCMYFVDYFNIDHPNQRTRGQARLYLVPVYDNPALSKEDTTSDFKALNAYYSTVSGTSLFKQRKKIDNTFICYNNCDSSVLTWSNITPQPTTDYVRLNKSQHSVSENKKERFMLTKNRSANDGVRSYFETGQGRTELNSKQTKRVYFSRETILRLATFLKSGNNLIDFPMVGIYFLSYNTLYQHQEHPNQTTLAFVPLRKIYDGYLEPDPCSYVTFYNKMVEDKSALFIKSENHGELCPKNCPPEGN